MALTDQATLAADATFKARARTLLVAKALTVAGAGARASDQTNEDELRLAKAVLDDPDAWATRGAIATASLMTGAVTTWPAAAVTATSDDAALRSAVLQGARSVWTSLAGAA